MVHASPKCFAFIWRSVLLLLAMICLLQVGCASNAPSRVAIPTYQWINAEQGIFLANQRATSIDTIFAVGDLLLDIDEHADAQGKRIKAGSVKLQTAVVALGNDYFHLRAWHKKQPVIAITLNPQGLWVWTAPGSLPLPMSNELIRLMPAILRGSLATKTAVLKDGSPWLRLKEVFPTNGLPTQYLMHKPTLTLRRYEYMASDSSIAEAVNLEDYDLIDMYPWPRRLIASSDAGSLQIDFTDVQLNTRLPDQAFVPPDAAVKQ